MVARPGIRDVNSAVRGLTIRGDLTSSILPKITFSPTIGLITKRIDKLGIDIRSFREPLKRSIQRVIAPSMVMNFDVGGRPAWVPLSSSTVLIRERMKQGNSDKILVKTGLLRRTMGQLNIWDISRDTAIIAHLPEKIWYGSIHQGGGHTGDATIPARPFAMLQDEDVDHVQQVFAEWLEERIARTWGGA
jgi:phage gpG-like protein